MRLVEQKLGLPSGYLDGGDVLVAYIEPKNMSGLRLPSGNEPGASSQWIPGGYTSRGVSEGVLDFSKIKEFKVLSFR